MNTEQVKEKLDLVMKITGPNDKEIIAMAITAKAQPKSQLYKIKKTKEFNSPRIRARILRLKYISFHNAQKPNGRTNLLAQEAANEQDMLNLQEWVSVNMKEKLEIRSVLSVSFLLILVAINWECF